MPSRYTPTVPGSTIVVTRKVAVGCHRGRSLSSVPAHHGYVKNAGPMAWRHC